MIYKSEYLRDYTRTLIAKQSHRRAIDVGHLTKRPNEFTIQRVTPRENEK